MIARVSSAAACILTMLLAPNLAFAWNKAGHMCSAAIAHDVLKHNSQGTIAKFVTVMKEHPQYDDVIEHRLDAVADEEKDRYLFMITARWPDDIRGDADYDVPEWHFVNTPFVLGGEADVVKIPSLGPVTILSGFRKNLEIIQGQANDDEKAQAWCWIFHLVGDVHQPLHAVALYSSQFPNGDRGGTRFHIKVSDGSAPVSLHKFWDDLIIGSQRYQSVKNKAIELRHRPEFAEANLTELTETHFDNWANVESLQIARDVAYKNGTVKGGTTASRAVKLPENYATAAKKAAERRIVLSGYRLARILRENLR